MAINIGKFLNEKNIENKIYQLCAGLDAESIKCINTILARLKLTANIKDKKIYNLTQEEQAALRAIEQEFFPNIISLGGCYFYGGFFLPINHFEVSVFYHKHHLNMIKHWERIIDKNIIDVGAYIGDSAIILQNYTREKVYSFEAVSANYQLMLQTIQLNKANNVVPIQKALGSKSEKLKISLYGAGSSIAINKNQEFEEVEVITLDSFVCEHNLEIGFIKVDIEGFEMEFLQGALETIRKQKPTMLVSIYHQGSDFFGIKPFLENLGLGYTFKVCKPIEGSVSGETCLFCEII